MSEHTPGPWVWYEGYDTLSRHGYGDREKDWGPCDGVFSADGKQVIVGVWRNDDNADCEFPNEADKALVLAAPELLRLLDRAVYLLDTWTADPRLQDEINAIRRIRDRLVGPSSFSEPPVTDVRRSSEQT